MFTSPIPALIPSHFLWGESLIQAVNLSKFMAWYVCHHTTYTQSGFSWPQTQAFHSIHSIGDFSLKLHNQTKNGKCKFKVRFLRSSWTLRLAYDEALSSYMYIYMYIYVLIALHTALHATLQRCLIWPQSHIAWSVCNQIKMKSNDQSRVNQGRSRAQNIPSITAWKMVQFASKAWEEPSNEVSDQSSTIYTNHNLILL